MNGILISEPITALYSIIRMPSPIIIVHVSQRSVDSALRSNCMRPRREKFGDAGSLEALLDQSEGSSESRSSCANDNSIEGMIDHRVLLEERALSRKDDTSASLERCSLPMTLKLKRGAEGSRNVLFANNLSIQLDISK